MNQVLALSGCSDYPLALKGSNQRLSWHWLDEGVLHITPLDTDSSVDKQVLISTGIHGNETAPIEIVAQIVCALLNGARPLAVELLVVFGNIKAIEEGKRYVDADLNRMFNGRYTAYADTDESLRAANLEQHVLHFFAPQTKAKQHFHFDLHTAIRGSVHEKFGLLPQRLTKKNSEYFDWLVGMGLEAIVVNPTPSGTFSSFTSHCCQALSCTLELGKATPFGSNDLTNFYQINEVLIKLISGKKIDNSSLGEPVIYIVDQELTKLSDQFKFITVDDNVNNFTRYTEGTIIADDGEIKYQVTHEFGWILFPNPSVKVGLRAGILLAEGDHESLFVEK
ncbi:succinylglutamate desuccinylase [Psychromonas sp. GE-S-Ul-11]|uniref:succinylglutamate desuccinylase n=1 Tax=Psychromonas sp. GE-S-Ul-11 TaxID=3241170 RepID=UPI00390C537E